MDTDCYKTIESPAQGVFKSKGSRFIAMAYPVSDLLEIKPILDKLRKEHHEARHHCYAYMIGHDRDVWRANDDGEPSGTAGKPILGQINSYSLTNILIVVVRYFGGTLLGVSGLISAYRSAAALAIENSSIIERTVQEFYEITFPYIAMNEVMKILKEENAGQTDQRFDLECKITVYFRSSVKEHILHRFSRVEGLTFSHLETR